MREVQVFVLVLLAVLLIGMVLSWAANDARRRGKSPVLVLIAVVFFFPFGLIAWLVFRPAVR